MGLVFQQIDVEENPDHNGASLRMFGVTDVSLSPYSSNSSLTIVCSQDGHSVLMHVLDFLPYFYVAAPRGFLNTDTQTFREYLNVSAYKSYVA